MRSYFIYLKNHDADAPDFEKEVEAEDFEQAVYKLSNLYDLDEDRIRENTRETPHSEFAEKAKAKREEFKERF